MPNPPIPLVPSLIPAPSPRRASLALLSASLSMSMLGLAGCSVDRLAPPSASASAVHLHGSAHGGQQPVTGSAIQLYAAGTTGNASAAVALLSTSVMTDANGSFNITGDYTCPSSTAQVYITATGGNPGLAGNATNSALALVAALGDCGSLASISNIAINEATTVAAAWALAPFASSTTSIGATSTNAAGLRSAMQTAMLLADSTTGIAPSASLPNNAATETAKLYTLANFLSWCVNSNGFASCSSLFSDVAAGAYPSPSDTFQAALAVVSNPMHNVTGIFNDTPARAVLGRSLTSAPSDWTMSIAYTGGGMDSPTSLAIDGSGNVLVSSAGGALSGFSAHGSPLWTNGVSGYGLNQSVGVTIDSAANIWVANMLSTSSNPGSVVQISPSGNVLSGASGYAGGTINLPVAVAADSAGHVWVADQGQPAITLLANDGTILSGSIGFGSSVLTMPSAIAIDGSQNAWIADSSTGALVNLDSTGAILKNVSCCASPDSIAIDSGGTLWLGDHTNSKLAQVAADGTVTASGISGGGLNGPRSMSIDGADHLWITNNGSTTLSKFAGTHSPEAAATALSPSSGLGADARLQQPYGVGVDASGNVWVTSLADNRLISFVGLGTPVKTPKFGLPQQP